MRWPIYQLQRRHGGPIVEHRHDGTERLAVRIDVKHLQDALQMN